MIYNDIEELIIDLDYGDVTPVVLDSFNAVITDGTLEEAHIFNLWKIQDNAYVIGHTWTGNQPGCFWVSEVEAIYDNIAEWNTTKKFYKRIAKEFLDYE